MAEAELILMDVVEEHLDEAAFLWKRWESSLDSPIHTYDEVLRGEQRRLFAHLDGLIVGGAPAAEQVLWPALEADDREKVAAAALALLSSEDGDYLGRITELFAGAEAEAIVDGLGCAFERAEHPGVARAMIAIAASTDAPPAVRARALKVLAFRRADPGDPLKACFAHADPAIRAAAAAAAACPEGQKYKNFLLKAISATEVEVKDAAIATGLLQGIKPAWTECQVVAKGGGPGAPRAWLRLALLGGAVERELIVRALKSRDQAQRAAVIFAAGFSGWKAVAEACLPLLADEELGPLAGEAFCAITGLDAAEMTLEEDASKKDEPEGLPELEDDDLDENLVPGADAGLPLLDAERAQKWWSTARVKFSDDKQYLRGAVKNAAELERALATEPTRRRAALQFALAAPSPLSGTS